MRSGTDDGIVVVGGTSAGRAAGGAGLLIDAAGRAGGGAATAVRTGAGAVIAGCDFTSTGAGSSPLLPCEFTQATTTTETTAKTAPDTASRV